MTSLYPALLRKLYGMKIGNNCRISWRAQLDKSINPQGIHIGNDVWILSEAIILAHDYCRNIKDDVVIGNNCVIGVRAIIMPGVTIGDHTIVGTGSIVTKSFPNNCIIAGNPAKILKEGINVINGQIAQ